MTKCVVLFNGPPGSGKDTLANGIHERNLDASHLIKFAAPIKENCKNIYGLTQEEWDAIDSDQFTKAEPRPEFFGQTCRQVQINFSELFLKPTHDNRIFGNLAVNEMKKYRGGLALVSDSGFREEAEVVVEELGAENVLLVRISRGDCNFDNDSRDYIDLEDLGVQTLEIANDGTVEEALDKIEKEIQKWK